MRDYLALLTRWQEGQAREDRRTQQVTWILAEIHRNRDAKPDPYTLEDFAIHAWPLAEAEPATPVLSDEEAAWAEIQALQGGIEAFFGPGAGAIQNGTTDHD